MRTLIFLFTIAFSSCVSGQANAQIAADRRGILDSITSLNNQSQYDDALAVVREGEQEISNSDEAKDWLLTLSGYRGLVLLTRGDDVGAAVALERTVELTSQNYLPFLPMFRRLRSKVATRQGKHAEGLREIEQGLAAYRAGEENVGELLRLNIVLATCLDRLSREDEAVLILNETDSIAREHGQIDNAYYAELLSKKGDVLMQTRAYALALENLDRSSTLYKKLGNNQRALRVNYLRLGNLCLYTGDLARSLSYFKRYQALNYKLNRSEADLGKGYASIGLAHLFAGEFELAEHNLHRSIIALNKAYDANHPYVSMSKRYRGQALVGLERYGEAIETIRSGLRRGESNPDYEVKQLADDYNTLGKAHGQLARYDSAQFYFTKAETTLAAVKGSDSKSSIYAKLYSARFFLEVNDFEAADNRLTQALELLRYDSRTSLENHPMPIRLLLALETKAAISLSLYERDGNRGDLDAANAHSLKAIELLELITKDFLSESSQHHVEINYGIVTGAVRAACYLHELAPNEGHAVRALTIIEAFKARRLRAELKNNLKLRLESIPEATKELLDSLRTEITSLRQGLFDGKEDRSTSEYALKEGELAARSDSYEYLKTSLLANSSESWFPFFAEAENGANLQRTPPHAHQTMLQFFATDEELYLLSQTGDEAPLVSKMSERKWLDLKRLIKGWAAALGTEQASANTGLLDSVSVLLWPLLEEGITSKTSELLVIPSGILAVLPFGSLKTDEGWLLDRFSVQYAYSKRLLDQQRSLDKPAPARPFAAFAPVYDSTWARRNNFGEGPLAALVRSGEYHLPGAAREALEFSELLGGDAFRDTAASKRAFLDQAQYYGILHLAMHAELNAEEADFSRLFFFGTEEEEGALSSAEIRGLELNADLVVLAACETGLGNQVDGEGVLSLSRAFAYAGVPATVHSLWKVPDEQTYQLLRGFYNHLKNGEDKTEALRRAKLDFLADCEPELRHPFFWSGFVVVGDERPLYPKSWQWWWLLVGVAALGFAWWWRRRRQEE